VAGLVCVTPAAGFVTPMSGLLLGLIAGAGCYFACTTIKNTFKYDDSLDAFGVHGVGGTLGALLTGVFASEAVGGVPGLLEGNPRQVMVQAISVVVTMAMAVVVTTILLKVLDATMGLRVSQDQEIRGLDLSQHGEEGYIFL
jgi:Amt family ammonium transporter